MVLRRTPGCVAAEEGAPQCFLLTPKLLSGLDYNWHVNVLEIFNGTFISAVSHNFKSVRALPRLQMIECRVVKLIPSKV